MPSNSYLNMKGGEGDRALMGGIDLLWQAGKLLKGANKTDFESWFGDLFKAADRMNLNYISDRHTVLFGKKDDAAEKYQCLLKIKGVAEAYPEFFGLPAKAKDRAKRELMPGDVLNLDMMMKKEVELQTKVGGAKDLTVAERANVSREAGQDTSRDLDQVLKTLNAKSTPETGEQQKNSARLKALTTASLSAKKFFKMEVPEKITADALEREIQMMKHYAGTNNSFDNSEGTKKSVEYVDPNGVQLYRFKVEERLKYVKDEDRLTYPELEKSYVQYAYSAFSQYRAELTAAKNKAINIHKMVSGIGNWKSAERAIACDELKGHVRQLLTKFYAIECDNGRYKVTNIDIQLIAILALYAYSVSTKDNDTKILKFARKLWTKYKSSGFRKTANIDENAEVIPEYSSIMSSIIDGVERLDKKLSENLEATMDAAADRIPPKVAAYMEFIGYDPYTSPDQNENEGYSIDVGDEEEDKEAETAEPEKEKSYDEMNDEEKTEFRSKIYDGFAQGDTINEEDLVDNSIDKIIRVQDPINNKKLHIYDLMIANDLVERNILTKETVAEPGFIMGMIRPLSISLYMLIESKKGAEVKAKIIRTKIADLLGGFIKTMTPADSIKLMIDRDSVKRFEPVSQGEYEPYDNSTYEQNMNLLLDTLEDVDGYDVLTELRDAVMSNFGADELKNMSIVAPGLANFSSSPD